MSTKAQAAIEPLPDWSLPDDFGEPGGMYPLGLEAVGNVIVDTCLLPGITSNTPHPRYHSFFAWAFWTFEHEAGRSLSGADRRRAQRRWRARLEHVLRACTLYATPEMRGIVGRLTAVAIDGMPRDAAVPLTRKSPTGMSAANYGAAFRALGLSYEDYDGHHLLPLGEELAAAFDTTLRAGADAAERRAIQRLLRGEKVIEAGLLMDIAERFRIRPLVPGEPEHAVLLATFFRLDPTRQQADPLVAREDRARTQTLGLLLELAEQAQGTLSTAADTFFSVFASGAFVDGRPVKLVAAAFTEAFAVWQRYQERRHQKTVVTACWHEVLNGLIDADPKPVPASVLVGRVLRLAGRSPFLATWLGKDPLVGSVAAAQERVARGLPADHGGIGVVAWELVQRIEDLDEPSTERIGRALVLLLAVVHQWRLIADELSPPLRSLHWHGEWSERLTLPWMAHQVAARAEQTVGELLEWLVEWCVLAQALRVAYNKLDAGNRFFIQYVDDGFVLVQHRDASSYFGPDADRLQGAVRVLRGLGLLAPEDPLMATPAGRSVRDAVAVMR